MDDGIIYTGTKEKSDCYVGLEVKYAQGIDVTVKGRTEKLYGEHIEHITKEVLLSFDIEHALVSIEDFGALPFTLMARLETAAKQAYTIPKKTYLPPAQKTPGTTKERLRHSCIYMATNTPQFFVNAALHGADGVIFDLKNAQEKTAAQILVRNALVNLDFYGAEKMVYINSSIIGLEDLEHIVPHNVHAILIPKCETAKQVQEIAVKISQIKEECNTSSTETFLIPVIASALGVVNVYEIAMASNLNVALTLDEHGYLKDIQGNKESLVYVRSSIVNAARAAKIQAIDGILSSEAEAKSLGFSGKACQNLQQIPAINKAFFPTKFELEKAIAIANTGAEETHTALQLVQLAVKKGYLTENWKETWEKELLHARI